MHASSRPGFIERARRRLRAHAESGMAAVEFSLILPIMVVLWIGGVEVTQGLSIDRRLNSLAAGVGDLIARTKTLNYSQVAAIFNLAPGAMFPYPGTNVQIRVTAVNVSSGGTATVGWSCGRNTTPYSKGAGMNTFVPSALRVASSQVIMTEVVTTYTPTVGYVITGTRTLDDRLFFVPRLVASITLTSDSTSSITCNI
jgi:Flp pilus assembly protein TadG